MKRLDVEVDRLDPAGHPDRAASARTERDWLLAQLASAAGFSGRTRSFPGQDERARVAVGKAIRRALARITEADPVIGEHLQQSVRTGVRCCYWPGLAPSPAGDGRPRPGRSPGRGRLGGTIRMERDVTGWTAADMKANLHEEESRGAP